MCEKSRTRDEGGGTVKIPKRSIRGSSWNMDVIILMYLRAGVFPEFGRGVFIGYVWYVYTSSLPGQ